MRGVLSSSTCLLMIWLVYCLPAIAAPASSKSLYRDQLSAANSATNSGLEYSIELMRPDAKPRLVDSSFPFVSGDQIRLRIKSNFSGYAYIALLQGSTGKRAVLYPPAGQSSQVASGKNIVIPAVGHLTFDNHPGTERVQVTVSRQPLSEESLLSIDSVDIDQLKKSPTAGLSWTRDLVYDNFDAPSAAVPTRGISRVSSDQPSFDAEKKVSARIVQKNPSAPLSVVLDLKHQAASANLPAPEKRSISMAPKRDVAVDSSGSDSGDQSNDSASSLGKCYGLFVGTSSYADAKYPQLKNPVRDVTAVADVLEKKFGWQTELLTDATTAQIIGKLREYDRRTFGPNDQLFILFAGHGLFDKTEKMAYLVTHDSQSTDEARRSFISAPELITRIEQIPCRHTLICLDVCHGGTFVNFIASKFAGSTRSANDSADASLGPMISESSPLITRKLFASSMTREVSDGLDHSPFARQLLYGLREEASKKGFLTIGQLCAFTQNLQPSPKVFDLELNEPGSDFFFVQKR